MMCRRSERRLRNDKCPAGLPRAIRKELATLARKLNREHRALFAGNPNLRKRAGQFLIALLPPKPRRRGRPGIQSVTQAIRLIGKFRRQYRGERAEQIWSRVYPLAIPNYATMSELEQSEARQQLRERVRWRQKAKRRYSVRTRSPLIG
jgi:hypothetical protein